MKTVNSPDGSVSIDFPDETSDATIAMVMKKAMVDQGGMTTKETGGVGSFKYWRETAQNIPGSGWEYGKAMIEPVIHPITTGTNLYHIAQGIVGKVLPGHYEEEKYADALFDFFVKRYGSLDALQQTIHDDPVGFMGDVATILTSGGALATKVGPLAKVGELSTKLGKFAEPLSLAGQALKYPAKGAKFLGEEYLGFTTGLGRQAIKEATTRSREWVNAFRGRIVEEEIAKVARTGVRRIADDMHNTYRSQLSAIESLPKPPVMDLTPTVKSFEDMLGHFHIRRNRNGVLDSGSFIDSTLAGDIGAQNDIIKLDTIVSNAVIKARDVTKLVPTQMPDISSWLSGGKGFISQKVTIPAIYSTPLGMDLLKRQVSNLYFESHRSRALAGDIAEKIKAELVSKVPGYEKMVAGYEDKMDLLNQIEAVTTVSAGGIDRPKVNAVLERITRAMKTDNEFRLKMIDEVSKASGANLEALTSGRMMRSFYPQSFMGRAITVGEGISMIHAFDPRIATLLLTGSPRIVGEFLNMFSFGAEKVEQMQRSGIASTPVRESLFQIGRASKEKEKKNPPNMP